MAKPTDLDRGKSNHAKGKPTFVAICHMDDEAGQYEPHKVRTDMYEKFMGQHPDDIPMPESGVCPLVLDEDTGEDLPELEAE